MITYFNRFAISMTKAQAHTASHQGPCDDDVARLVRVPVIRRELARLDPGTLRAELAECGAWDADELADHEANCQRIVWIAACNIREECTQRIKP